MIDIRTDYINKAKLLGLTVTENIQLAPSAKAIDQHLNKNECILINGENLNFLNSLAIENSGLIDFCYIDPPYNTGSKFIYNDSRFDPPQGIWRKHSAWMSFMLPRLVLMREVLNNTGIAAISIDDYEYAQLKILMDHVFGEENYFGTIIVGRSKNGKGSKPHIAVNHEHVLIYGKSGSAKMLGLPEEDIDSYNRSDEHGRYKIDGLFRKKGAASKRSDRPNMFYPLYYDENGNVFAEKTRENLNEIFPVDSKGIERRWLWGIDKAKSESWKLHASPKGVVYVKNYLTDKKKIKVRSIWDDVRFLTEKATKEISEIYTEKVFETPKPIGLLEDLIKCCCKEDGLILDFFCGTATTAHATHNVNKQDGGKRKVILVEQPVKIEKSHVAAALGFLTIADIAEHRLRKIQAADSDYAYEVISG